LNVYRQQSLIALKEVSARRDRIDVKSIAVAYVFFALFQMLSTVGDLPFCCLPLKAGNQKSVVNLVDLQRDFIFGLLFSPSAPLSTEPVLG
jgi:hypothetical protein